MNTKNENLIIEQCMRQLDAFTPGAYPLLKERTAQYIHDEIKANNITPKDMVPDNVVYLMFTSMAAGFSSGYSFVANRSFGTPLAYHQKDEMLEHIMNLIHQLDNNDVSIDTYIQRAACDYADHLNQDMEDDYTNYRYLSIYSFIRGAQRAQIDDICGNIDEAQAAHPEHIHMLELCHILATNIAKATVERESMDPNGGIPTFIRQYPHMVNVTLQDLEDNIANTLHKLTPLALADRISFGEISIIQIAELFNETAMAYCSALTLEAANYSLPELNIDPEMSAQINDYANFVIATAHSIGLNPDTEILNRGTIYAIMSTSPDENMVQETALGPLDLLAMHEGINFALLHNPIIKTENLPIYQTYLETE